MEMPLVANEEDIHTALSLVAELELGGRRDEAAALLNVVGQAEAARQHLELRDFTLTPEDEAALGGD